ncbi:MAG TPA: hypothetical protein VFW33_16490 [Gemmataceae bacterium]|nr:hypothetical protein [Gemmataceae bacterium]
MYQKVRLPLLGVLLALCCAGCTSIAAPLSLGLADSSASNLSETHASSGSNAAAPSAPGTNPANQPGANATLTSTTLTGPAKPQMYVLYYLWWSTYHWHNTLGPNYPYTQLQADISAGTPPPLPGTVDASGCNEHPTFTGSQIVDIPSVGLYDQAQASTFDKQIALATSHSITGFIVDWIGTGSASQTPSSSGYNSRFDLMVKRVDAWNATHTTKFSIGMGLDVFGNYNRPASQVVGDLTYFRNRYGADSAFKNAYSTKPLVFLVDSKKYPVSTVSAAASAVGGGLFLIGDETPKTFSRDASYIQGVSWYWSSQNPYNNPQSGQQVAALANAARAAGKTWFSPVIAGFNHELAGGGCVPRNGLQTLDTLWKTNAASKPNGWFAISWNEYVENTFLEPSVRWGSQYIDELARLIRSQ